MRGVICGTVLESKYPKFAAGEMVSGLGIWADYQIGTPDTVPKMAAADGVSVPEAFGLSSYFGLLDIGKPKPGETVVVSAAMGEAISLIVGSVITLAVAHVYYRRGNAF